jgi:hypothetical protein
MPTQRMKPIHLFVPFETIERRDEDGAYIVEGYAFCNEVVGGEGGIRLKRSAMEAATPDYLKFGAIREMHQPIAAGTCLQATWDEKGCRLRAEIVDDAAIKKIERKVYKGFSVGVNPRDMTEDRVVEVCDWPETSLVDRPKDPDALFLHRVEGYDPDAEVEVEVHEDPPPSDAHPAAEEAPPPGDTPHAAILASPAEAPADAEASGVRREASVPATTRPDTSPDLSPTVPSPDAEANPPLPAGAQAPGASGGGDLSDEQRTALTAFLAEQGLSANLVNNITVEQAPAPGLTSSVVAPGPGVAEYEQVVAAAQRNQTIGTVPTRENLEKFRPKSPEEVNDALSEPPRGDYRVEQAPTGMWCVYGPDGSKLGEFATRAEANARVAEAKEAMQEPSRAAAADPAMERVIKHEDGKWCVYSESGKKLGEHDTKAEAVDQLQAIEISKHKDEEGATQPKERAAESGEAQRFGIAEVAGQFAVWDAERDTFQRFDTREAAEHRLAALIQVSGEQPDEATALQRLEIVTADLLRAQAERNSAIERATAAEAEVKRLENTPARLPVVRYPQAMGREFLANLGGEGEATVARLRKEYADAEAEAKAERQGDVDKRNRALERMLRCQGELAEHGVFL